MTDQLDAPLDDFKPREREILGMMAEGLSNKAIAERLYITTQTVRWYNKQIYSKLGTSRRTEAIALARRFGLITDDLLAADEAGAVSGISSRYTLPLTNGPFIGRDEELAELSALLAEEGVRLLSVVAAGGMGKSRLSLELAHHLQAGYTHGAAFIDLTPARQPDDLLTLALDTLNITPSGEQTPKDALLGYCRAQSLLLIFDNMEHIIEGAALLADLLAVAPQVTLIATSRERLNLQAETVYYLQPVTESGSKLFIETARIMRPTISLNDHELADVDRVVDLTGGLPLALVLAATWVDTLSIAEIADEIAASLDFLEAGLGDMPDRQHSIRAVIDPSWKRLSPAEQQACMWVSVFRGGFTASAFKQVTGASVRVLQTLLGRSLVMPGYGRRYDMHPLIRQYAREKLTASGAVEAAKDAHLLAFKEYVEAQQAAMTGDTFIQSLDNIALEHDNVRAALDWSLAGGDAGNGVRLALALCWFWQIRSHGNEAHRYLSRLLEQPLSVIDHQWVLCWRGRFGYRIGGPDQWKPDLEAVLAQAESLGDDALLALALTSLAAFSHDPAERQILAQRGMQSSEAAGATNLVASSLNTLAQVADAAQDWTQSIAHYNRSLAQYEANGNILGVSQIVYNMGLTYNRMGEYQRARDAYEHSLRLKRQLGDRAGAARRLAALASLDMYDEQYEQAIERLQESHRLLERTGERIRWTYVNYLEACMHVLMTDFDQAYHLLESGFEVAEVYMPARFLDYLTLMVALSVFRQKMDTAHDRLMHLFNLIENVDDPEYQRDTLLVYALFRFQQDATDTLPEVVRITATLVRSKMDEADIMKNILESHVYRVRNVVGDTAWEAAQQSTAGTTLSSLIASARMSFTGK